MPAQLPPHSTPHSQRLYAIAAHLAGEIAHHSGGAFTEIALTGSTARGTADADSDIEMNIWAEPIPPETIRAGWLAAAGLGAIEIIPGAKADGSVWIEGVYDGVPVEVGWQTPAALETALNDIIAGRTLAHKALRLREIISGALTLAGSGVLARWQPELEPYPPGLGARLCGDVIAAWERDSWRDERLRALACGASPVLYALLTADMERLLRLAFALNQHWEPGWKHARGELERLPNLPDDFIARLDAAFGEPDARLAVIAWCDLMRDALMRVPQSPYADLQTARAESQVRALRVKI